jgi:hypothetical protein
MIEVTQFGANVARPWEQVNIMSTTGDVLAGCDCSCACPCSCLSIFSEDAGTGGYRNNAGAVAFPEP